MFHDRTLEALKELVQAAGLQHPNQIGAAHIVRRVADHDVMLLANLLPFVQPGELLEGRLPQRVFERWWREARADSFALATQPVAHTATAVAHAA